MRTLRLITVAALGAVALFLGAGALSAAAEGDWAGAAALLACAALACAPPRYDPAVLLMERLRGHRTGTDGPRWR